MKNITVIGVNYFSEDTATGLYTTQMVKYLSDNGYNMEVITGFPYYPKWEISEDYKKRFMFVDEMHGDVKVHRYKQYVPKNPSFKLRILHLLDFTLGSMRNIFKVKKCDLVIAIVPFTLSIFLALILAKLRGAKVWVHIQDFEFDAAIDSGLINAKKGLSGKLFALLMKLEKFLLNRSDLNSTISHSMIKKMETKSTTPTYFFPNWVNPDDINPATSSIHPLLKSNKFKILYSGNIGAKQDWQTFIKVAKHYKNNNNIEFIVIGDGANKEDLVAKTTDLKNVVHHYPIDFADLSNLLCSANLHVLFQKNNVIDTVMPSKILGMMASAKPSLVTGSLESETATLFADSKGGFFVDSDDFDGIINKIDMLQTNKKEAQQTGLKARKYIVEKFGHERVLSAFTQRIQDLLL